MNKKQREDIYGFMASRGGMALRWELRERGCSNYEIDWALENGDLQSLRRGVLGLPGIPFTAERQQRAAVLVAGKGAVLSHFGAAGRLSFPQIGTGQVEISVPRKRAARLIGVAGHVTPELADADVVDIDGIACTSAARTALDLTDRVGVKVLRKIVAHVERKRRPNAFLEIRDAASRISIMRRPAIEPLLQLIDRVDVSDSWLDLTPRVLAGLERAGIRKPLLEHPVTWGGQDYICDMAFVPEWVNLEMDDDWSHATSVGSQSDKARDLRARRAGWDVARATPATDVDAFCDHVAWLLARKARAA